MKLTIDKIVDDVLLNLSVEQKNYIREHEKNDLIELHNTLGQTIRNDYKLWSYSWDPDLLNGVDCSKDHPDNLSASIIDKLHARLTDDFEQGKTNYRNKVITTYLKNGWKYIDDTIKDGEIYILLVENSETPLQDDIYTTTIGFNTLNDSGDDKWRLVGWNWSQDELVEDLTAIPILYLRQLEHINVE